MPKYDVAVDLGNLAGPGGNAFAVMGNVQSALRKAGAPKAAIDEYIKEAMSGDYNNLLAVSRNWVNVKTRKR